MTEKNETDCCKETTHASNERYWTIGLAVLCGLLIITAGVQAVELTQLSSELAQLPDLVESSGNVRVSTSLDDSMAALPEMVGGC